MKKTIVLIMAVVILLSVAAAPNAPRAPGFLWWEQRINSPQTAVDYWVGYVSQLSSAPCNRLRLLWEYSYWDGGTLVAYVTIWHTLLNDTVWMYYGYREVRNGTNIPETFLIPELWLDVEYYIRARAYSAYGNKWITPEFICGVDYESIYLPLGIRSTFSGMPPAGMSGMKTLLITTPYPPPGK